MMWHALIGEVLHVGMDALTRAWCTVSTGLRWTGYDPEGVCSNRDRPTLIERLGMKGRVPHRLHSVANEPTMVGHERPNPVPN